MNGNFGVGFPEGAGGLRSGGTLSQDKSINSTDRLQQTTCVLFADFAKVQPCGNSTIIPDAEGDD